MIYKKCLYILIMALILNSCKGSNDYIFMNSGCNCQSYMIDQDKFLLSLSGMYYLIDTDLSSEFHVKIFNKTDEAIQFSYKGNYLTSKNILYEINSEDTIFNIPPKTSQFIRLYFNGKLKNNNGFPDKDEQILKINGLMDGKGKGIEVEDIRLVTTTWNY